MNIRMPRRCFVRLAGTALAAASVLPGALAAEPDVLKKKRGIKKAIMLGTVTREDEAVRYLDEINSPQVMWHFDIGNIIYYGDPIKWLKALGKRISRLHIKEYSLDAAMKGGTGAGFNVDFLEGANNWPGIMKALDEIGYTGSGWGIAEQRGAGDLGGLKNLSGRMDRIFAS